jgi:hypothetical protein
VTNRDGRRVRTHSPEAQLLLHAAAGSETDAALIALLAEPISWPKLFALVQYERAETIVYRRLRALPADVVPEIVLAQLRKLSLVVEFRMTYLEQRLERVGSVLGAIGMRPVLLKGAGLAYTAYGSFADRPMRDLDVLVERERADEAYDTLLRDGWVRDTQAEAEVDYRGHHHRPPLFDQAAPWARLELHHALFVSGNPFGLTGERMLEQAVSLPGGPAAFRVPVVQHQLLHACVHFAWSHLMRVGSWQAMRDMRAITERGEIAWPEFVAEARQTRAVTCCYWTLRLARDLVGARVPEETLRALRPPLPSLVLKRLERQFVIQLFPADYGCPSLAVERLMWEAGMMPGWSGHGRVRPWDVDEVHAVYRDPSHRRAETRYQKAMRHLHGVQAWTRYVREVLSAVPSA